MGLINFPSPAIILQFFGPIMTLTISKKAFGLVSKISVETLVCLVCIQNVKVEHFLRKYKIHEIEKISTKIYAYEPTV